MSIQNLERDMAIKMLDEQAKEVSKNLAVSRQGPDYYLHRTLDPLNFVELVHVKAQFPFTHQWAMNVIAGVIKDLRIA
jgi:hypothetical protein